MEDPWNEDDQDPAASGSDDDARSFDADDPDLRPLTDPFDDDPLSEDDSLFLAPRLKFKAGGSLSLDGDNPEQSTFQPSKMGPKQRSEEPVEDLVAVLPPTSVERPEPLGPELTETLTPIYNEAGPPLSTIVEITEERDNPFPSELGTATERPDDAWPARSHAEQEDITFAPLEANDGFTNPPRDFPPARRFDASLTSLTEPRERDEVMSGPAVSADRQAPSAEGSPADAGLKITGLAQPLIAFVRGSALGAGRGLVVGGRSAVSSAHRLIDISQTKAKQVGQTWWQVVWRHYEGLRSGAMQHWPRVANRAQNACSSLAKLLSAQSQVAAERTRHHLNTSMQQLGVLIRNVRQRAKMPIAGTGPNPAEKTDGDAADTQRGATLSSTLSKLTIGFPSLASFKNLRTMGLSSIKTSPRLAVVGLAAASVVIVFLIAGHTQFTPSARASLTFPLPERPVIETLSLADATLEESANAIDNIIDYVASQSPVVEREAPADENPILETVARMDGFDEFVRAAKTVDLGQLLAPGEAYTIFLPSDEAFAKLDREEVEGLLAPTGHERLLTLLSHHIIPERITLDTLKNGSRPHVSLAGRKLTVDGGDAIRIDDVRIVDTGPEVENSIVHVIDRVLTYPEL